jgi:hypothetical protein
VSIAEQLNAIDASYEKTIEQMRHDWNRYDRARKQELIDFLKQSPVGSEFERRLIV